MKNITKEKKVIVFFVFLLFFLLLIWFVYAKKNYQSRQNQGLITPTSESLPLVDSSVKVELMPLNSNREVNLKITNIPKETNEIEYVITYETKNGALQGVNSTAKVNGTVFERKITLGTCSSGTCVYHQVKDKIKVELLFKGGYGEKYFTNEYDLIK
jgi:hypothetical protein